MRAPVVVSLRLNGRNYRATTQTALKRQAADIEARERSRILEGRHGIRRQPDIAFREFATHYLDASNANKTSSSDTRDREIVMMLNRFFWQHPASRTDGTPHRTIQARPAGGSVEGARAEEARKARTAGHRQSRTRHAARDPRMGSQGGEAGRIADGARSASLCAQSATPSFDSCRAVDALACLPASSQTRRSR